MRARSISTADSTSAETSEPIFASLYRIGKMAYGNDDPSAALQVVLEECVTLFSCTSASIALINPNTKKLEIEVYKGLPDDAKTYKLSLHQGITGWVALHSKPLIITDTQKDRRYIPLHPDVRSEMAVPLISGPLTIGVLNVDSKSVQAFDEGQLTLLLKVAEEATAVVNRLWQLQQLKRKTDHLHSIIQTGHNIVTKLDLADILNHITGEAQRLMGCKVCAIFMLEDEHKKLHLNTLSGTAHLHDYIEELDLHDSSLGVAVKRKKSIEVYDLAKTEEHHFVPLIQKEKLVSMLSTPLVFDGHTLGLINAYTDKPHRFHNDEKRLMQALASYGSVAIQNYRLYKRVFQSEEILHQNERLTTLGMLAAEIAHEIRNPLTVIKLLFQSLQIDYKEDDPRAKDVHIIAEKLDHLESIVSNVLEFGKSKQAVKTRTDVNVLIEETIQLIRIKLQQHKIRIQYTYSGNPVYAELHKGQLQQALLNLVINSMQAMPAGGEIGIDCHKRDNKVYITLSDHGEGIPHNIQERIFDSFLTARKDGTGLGLGITKRILKGHKGDIELIESNSAGTRFQMWLPALGS